MDHQGELREKRWLLIVSGKEPDDIRIVVSALIPRDGKLLLIKRGESPKRGYYSFPEGHLKIGESPLAGLVRECKEEIGCLVKPLSDKVLILEGPSNAALPDDYLEKCWPPSNGRFGFHNYKVASLSSIELRESSKSSKKYIYVPCKPLGSPKETDAALEIVYLSPDEALELKLRGRLKLIPTTSLVLALIKLKEFTF